MKTHKLQQAGFAGLAGLVLATGAAGQTPDEHTMNIPYQCVENTSIAPYFEGGDVELTVFPGKKGYSVQALPAFGSTRRDQGQTHVSFESLDEIPTTRESAGTQEVSWYQVIGPDNAATGQQGVYRPQILGNNELSESFRRADDALQSMMGCYVDKIQPSLFPSK